MQLWTKAVRLAALAALAMVLALTLPPPIETMILRFGILGFEFLELMERATEAAVGCAADGVAG